MGTPIPSVLQLWTLLPSVGGFRLRQLRRFMKWKSYVLGEIHRKWNASSVDVNRAPRVCVQDEQDFECDKY